MSDDEDFIYAVPNGSSEQPSAAEFGSEKGRMGEVSFAAQGPPAHSGDSKKDS